MGTSLFIEEPPLQVLPSLAIAIGLNEAIVLQQFHYLGRIGGKVINGERWVFDTYEDLCSKFFPFWSEKTIQRIVLSLEDHGWLLSCQPEGVMSRRKYYRISNQARIHLTKEKLSENTKGRTSDFVPFDMTNEGIPLTEIPKPENTELKEQTLDTCRAISVSKECQKKASKQVKAPPVWEQVEKHAYVEGIDLSAAVRFFNLNEFYGWKTATGPIRCWKRALIGFVKAEPLNAKKIDPTTNKEFWAWANGEFDEDEIEHVKAWVTASTKSNWRRVNRITGQSEPINDYRKACRSFVDSCVEMNIIR